VRPRLAGDGEDDEIRPLAVVGVAADDDGGAALAGGLVGEGERDEEDVPKVDNSRLHPVLSQDAIRSTSRWVSGRARSRGG